MSHACKFIQCDGSDGSCAATEIIKKKVNAASAAPPGEFRFSLVPLPSLESQVYMWMSVSVYVFVCPFGSRM